MAPLTRRQKKALDAAPPTPVIDAADRIISLPPEILAHIQSLLPAQEAVQTCILARTWRDVWKSISRLLITGDSVQEAREFVDRLLINFASLDASEIRFDPSNVLDDPDPLDNRWMCRVLECQIHMLRIDISASGYSGAWMPLNDRFLISRHLTRLELTSVEFGCRCLNLDGCPALEHLEIDQCFMADVWKIMSLSLKHLVITSCNSDRMRHRIQICVPHLVSLFLDGGNEFRTPLLQRMPELVSAKVQIPKSSEIDHCKCEDPMACYHVTRDTDLYSYDDKDGSGDYARQNTTKCVVLEGLAEAKDLVLTSSPYNSTYIFRRDLRWCPTFSKLKTLVLNHDYWCQPADCSSLACILEHEPLLEKLTLIPYMRWSDKYEVQMRGHPDGTMKSTKISQQLKTVEINCGPCGNVDERFLNVLSFLGTLNIRFGITVTRKKQLSH